MNEHKHTYLYINEKLKMKNDRGITVEFQISRQKKSQLPEVMLNREKTKTQEIEARLVYIHCFCFSESAVRFELF